MNTIRRVELPLDGERVARHWFLGSALLTHLNNAMFLLFPEGERAFVRLARRVAAPRRGRSPDAHADVEAFIAQEAQHAREHQRFFAIYQAQGLPYREIVARAAAVARGLERGVERACDAASAEKILMAVTAALEHYTASWGAQVFRDLGVLDAMDPDMRRLLLWHFAEELEHKHVAFDLLRELSDSYALRATGMLLATALLWPALALVMLRLLCADDQVTLRRLAREGIDVLRFRDNVLVTGARNLLHYLRPGFHPDEIAVPEAARAWLAGLKAAGRGARGTADGAKSQPP